MKTVTKRFLSLALCLVLLFSCVALSAAADEASNIVTKTNWRFGKDHTWEASVNGSHISFACKYGMTIYSGMQSCGGTSPSGVVGENHNARYYLKVDGKDDTTVSKVYNGKPVSAYIYRDPITERSKQQLEHRADQDQGGLGFIGIFVNNVRDAEIKNVGTYDVEGRFRYAIMRTPKNRAPYVDDAFASVHIQCNITPQPIRIVLPHISNCDVSAVPNLNEIAKGIKTESVYIKGDKSNEQNYINQSGVVENESIEPVCEYYSCDDVNGSNATKLSAPPNEPGLYFVRVRLNNKNYTIHNSEAANDNYADSNVFKVEAKPVQRTPVSITYEIINNECEVGTACPKIPAKVSQISGDLTEDETWDILERLSDNNQSYWVYRAKSGEEYQGGDILPVGFYTAKPHFCDKDFENKYTINSSIMFFVTQPLTAPAVGEEESAKQALSDNSGKSVVDEAKADTEPVKESDKQSDAEPKGAPDDTEAPDTDETPEGLEVPFATKMTIPTTPEVETPVTPEDPEGPGDAFGVPFSVEKVKEPDESPVPKTTVSTQEVYEMPVAGGKTEASKMQDADKQTEIPKMQVPYATDTEFSPDPEE